MGLGPRLRGLLPLPPATVHPSILHAQPVEQSAGGVQRWSHIQVHGYGHPRERCSIVEVYHIPAQTIRALRHTQTPESDAPEWSTTILTASTADDSQFAEYDVARKAPKKIVRS